ncbi:MAG: glucose-1-phosphate thymidylyltransferase, partial [Gemmatimonas sp.]
FDTTLGPILVRKGATVQAFTRVVGPCYIGANSTVMGDRISGSAIGDTCRVHGELSATVFVGHSNKGHDGFVGHSIVGRWVNMGAGTITSNLKNTYGTVALWTPNGIRDTGLQFLGTLFGDHAKTGIGMKLTTGCVLGTAANVFDKMPPKVVEPFAWGTGAPYDSYSIDKFVETAERMMSRRQVTLTDEGRAFLREVHAARWRTS